MKALRLDRAGGPESLQMEPFRDAYGQKPARGKNVLQIANA